MEEDAKQPVSTPPPAMDTQGSANGLDYSGQIDNSAQGAPGNATLGEGFSAEVVSGILGGATGAILNLSGHQIAAHNTPQHLSEDEWRAGPFFRKGLSVGEGGVNKGVARYNALVFDKQKERDDTIAHMPQGWESKVARFGGGALGFALDPINAVAGELVEPLIWGKAGFGALTSAIDDLGIKALATKTAVSAGKGVVTGVAVGVPQTVGNLSTEDLLGEHVEGLNALVNLGVYGALGGITGGIIGGVTGFLKGRRAKFGITPDQNRSVMATAVSQLSSDKNLELEPQIKAAYNHTRLTEPAVDADVQAKVTDSVDTNFKTEEKRFTQSNKNLKAHEEKFEAETPEVKVATIPLGANGLFARASDILTKDPITRTEEEATFLQNIPETADIQKGMAIINRGTENMTPEDTQFLKGLTPAKEERTLNSSVKKSTRELSTEKVESLTPEERMARVEKEKELEINKSRLDELKERAEKLSPVLKRVQTNHASKWISFTKAKQGKLANDLFNKMTPESLKEVSPADVRTTVDKIDSPEGDTTYNQRDLDALAEQEAAIKEKGEEPERNFDKEREEVLNLDKEGELDDGDKEILESIKQNKSILKRLPVILRDYGKCILGLAT